jgi:glycosyltransferase involved in cell wall biosynthesis
MNICHVVPIYLPGILPGCSKYVWDISKGLAKRGHFTTVLTANAITGRGWVDPLFGKYSSVKEETINGVRVKRLKTHWQITSTMHLLRKVANGFLPRSIGNIVSLLSAGPYLPKLKEEFQKERYEVIHVTAFPFALVWLVRKACQSLGKPFVCTPLIHFEDPSHSNPLLWKALDDAASVIACSNYEREGMIRKGIDPSRIHLIPMGIDLDEWVNPDGERFRKRYRLEGKKIILFAGTKGYNKGAIHLLQATERIARAMKDCVLVSIGLATREWNIHKNQLRQENLLDLGYVSDEEKRDAFAACNLFVMPSRYDSFGIVYLEAWRCAKPVIGAKVGAIPEVIEEGKDGLLVEFGDVDQLCSTILYLLNHPDLSREMGERGRKKVVEKLNWERTLPLIEKVYEEIPS